MSKRIELSWDGGAYLGATRVGQWQDVYPTAATGSTHATRWQGRLASNTPFTKFPTKRALREWFYEQATVAPEPTP